MTCDVLRLTHNPNPTVLLGHQRRHQAPSSPSPPSLLSSPTPQRRPHVPHRHLQRASDYLNGLHIKSSAGHSHPLPYFAFPGWGVVVIVDSSYSPADSLLFATAAAAAALRRELGAPPHPPPIQPPSPPPHAPPPPQASPPPPPPPTPRIMTPPSPSCAAPAVASSRWCDAATDLHAFALEVASMQSLTGASKLSSSFEAAVQLLAKAASDAAAL